MRLFHLKWGMYPSNTLVFFPVTSSTLTSPFLSFLHFPSLISHCLTSHSLTHSFQLTTASLVKINHRLFVEHPMVIFLACVDQSEASDSAGHSLSPDTLPAGFSTLFPEPSSSVHYHHVPSLGSGPAVGSLSDFPWVVTSLQVVPSISSVVLNCLGVMANFKQTGITFLFPEKNEHMQNKRTPWKQEIRRLHVTRRDPRDSIPPLSPGEEDPCVEK